jgi:hypothetical protein
LVSHEISQELDISWKLATTLSAQLLGKIDKKFREFNVGKKLDYERKILWNSGDLI